MKLKTSNRYWESKTRLQFIRGNYKFYDRSIQNCERYSTVNNEFSFSVSLQHKQHQNFQENYTENRKTVRYGTETVMYWAPLLWANLHSKYKKAKPLDEFKSKIKAWKYHFCQCRFCKKYLQNLGFI